MKLRANAKINLTLDIVGKRPDGYHIIDSVFQSLSLCDEITVEKCDEILVSCDNNSLCDKSNIAYKSAQKFFEYTSAKGGASIYIKKHIPLSSGLGGGSADAAGVLLALDKIYNTKLTENELLKIAVSVGADVPFCLFGGAARVGGIGEKIEKLPIMPDCAILLVKHGEKQSTADMYKKIHAFDNSRHFTDSVVDAMINGDLNAVCKGVSNAFSNVCDNRKLIDDIKSTEPNAVSLSGSGPTVFAVYNNTQKAQTAQKQLETMGYCPIITAPGKSGIIFL